MNSSVDLTYIPVSKEILLSKPAPEVFTGAGRNYYTVSLASIRSFLQSPEPTEPAFDVAFQLSLLIDCQKGLRPLTDAAPWAQNLYGKWAKQPEALLSLKKALPALLPSVHYLSLPSSRINGPRRSPRSMIRRSTSFWKHTGIFGLDVDGIKGDDEATKARVIAAYDYFKVQPGFLFGYISPSGGFKGYLKVSDDVTEMLNVEDAEDDLHGATLRQARHKAVFEYISGQLKKATGISLDSSTGDISRMQFFYHGEYLPSLAPDGSVYNIARLESLLDRADTDAVDPVADDELLTSGEEVPLLIQKFPQWLRDHGYPEAADGVEAMTWKGSSKVGYCPQCKEVATTERKKEDLRLCIVRDFPSQSWFYCLHEHCQNKNSGVESMNTLFQKYVEDLDSHPYNSTPVLVPEASSILQRVYHPDGELVKALKTFGPFPLCKAYVMPHPEQLEKLDFPVRDAKGIPVMDLLNVSFLFKHLKLMVVSDIADDTKSILDFNTGRAINLTDEFAHQIALQWSRYLNKGKYNMQQLQNGLYAIFQAMASNEFYHPLAASICIKPWDGVDRVSQYINTMELDEDKAPEGWKARDWLNYVLRTWMYTIINHMEMSLENTSAICPSFCPILIGKQGCGKSAWAQYLLDKFPGCFSGNFDLKQDKDALVQKSSTLVIQLDEIDRYLSNAEDASLVKRALDLTPAKTRAAYRKDQSIYHPKAVFIATSNISSPLTDETGNRRYSLLYISPMEGDFKKAKNTRDSIDKQQLWCQIHEEYHTLAEPIGDRVQEVVRLSDEINKRFGLHDTPEAVFIDKLRPVDWSNDKDRNGKPLWKHIPRTYRSPKLVLQILMTIQQNQGIITSEPDARIRVGQQAAIGLKQAISETFGPEYAIPKQAVDGTNARRMRVMLVDDWLEWASKETKEYWYNKFPEWREWDEQTKETMV